MVSLKRSLLSVESSINNAKRQCVHKEVRFSDSYTERTAENYFSGLDKTHEDALRAQLWYNPRDFEQFMRDRATAIRFLRAVGGDESLLPGYSLRGFEFYLNPQVSSLRAHHVQTVFREQQKGSSADQIAEAALPKSVYAVNRARQFAMQDALEARSEKTQVTNASPPSVFTPPFSPLVHKQFGASSVTSMMPKSMSATAASRESLMKLSLLPRRANVDMSKLRQMNRQFLQGLTCTAPLANKTNGSTFDLLNEALKAASSD